MKEPNGRMDVLNMSDTDTNTNTFTDTAIYIYIYCVPYSPKGSKILFYEFIITQH